MTAVASPASPNSSLQVTTVFSKNADPCQRDKPRQTGENDPNESTKLRVYGFANNTVRAPLCAPNENYAQ